MLPGGLHDPARYAQLFAEAIGCTARSGDQQFSYYLHGNAGNAGNHAMTVGDLAPARAHLEQALQLAQATGYDGNEATTTLGFLPGEGDPDGARSMFEAALRMCRRSRDREGPAYPSLGLLFLAADLGDWHRAAVLHGAAQAFLDRTRGCWNESTTPQWRDCLDQLRARLGEGHI